MEAARDQRRQQASGEHAGHHGDAEIQRQPVDSITYCTLSAIGAMKVSDVTGGGIEIIGAEIAGGEPAGGHQQADPTPAAIWPGDAGTAHARTQR